MAKDVATRRSVISAVYEYTQVVYAWKVVKQSGNFSLTSLIPSKVFLPASRNSSSPVAKVKVRTSKINCSIDFYLLTF